MNLTSKRILQVLSACVGAIVLTASAQTVWVSDNFEAEGDGNTNAAIDSAAGLYKAHIWGASHQYSNMAWVASSGDASTIQAFEGTYADGRPITNDNAQAQALKLETEGQTLTRYVAFAEDDGGGSDGTPVKTPAPIAFGVSPVYVDTLIKFTPSEDDPEINDPNIKVAIFVNANSNLVVCHNYTDGGALYHTNSVFENLGVIDPVKWYRLTIQMDYANAGFLIPAFQVYVDGTLLTHANGAIDTEGFTGGSWFFTREATISGGSAELTQVSFQGTGYVDDLVVADYVTPFGGSAGLTLTLSFNDTLLDLTIDGVAVTPDQEIASGSVVKMNTIEWYQINSITGDGVTADVTAGAVGGSMNTNATVEFTVIDAGKTATINAGQFTGSIAAGLPGYATLPADKLAAWALASGLSIQDVMLNAVAYLDNYLLNIDESISADLEITSIVVDEVNEIATITVSATDTAVDFTKLNGTLVVWTSGNLTAWGEPATFDITSEDAGEVTITVPFVGGNFIKARVE